MSKKDENVSLGRRALDLIINHKLIAIILLIVAVVLVASKLFPTFGAVKEAAEEAQAQPQDQDQDTLLLSQLIGAFFEEYGSWSYADAFDLSGLSDCVKGEEFLQAVKEERLSLALGENAAAGEEAAIAALRSRGYVKVTVLEAFNIAESTDEKIQAVAYVCVHVFDNQVMTMTHETWSVELYKSSLSGIGYPWLVNRLHKYEAEE